MSFVCNDCPDGPDFKTKYNKENHQGQCHIDITECNDSNGILRRLVRQQDALFHCPTCGLACGISNFFRPHVTRCTAPPGSGLGKFSRRRGFATPEEAAQPRSRTSASPSPRLSPGPSSVPATPYSRPAKPVVTEQEKRQKREEEQDRLDRKREVALEFASRQKAEREEVKEKEKERLRRLGRGNVFAAVDAAPLPVFNKRAA